jgi:hypothetical protein
VQGLRDVIAANEQPALSTLASAYMQARRRSSSTCSIVPDAAVVASDAVAILRDGVRDSYEQLIRVLLRRTLKRLSAISPSLDRLAALACVTDVEVVPVQNSATLMNATLQHTPSTTDGKCANSNHNIQSYIELRTRS